MTSVKKKNMCFLCLAFCLTLSTLASETKDAARLEAPQKYIAKKIEYNIHQSNQEIKAGDYNQAEKTTDQTLTILRILIDALRPLEERIKKMLENETIILHKTNNLKKANLPDPTEIKKNKTNLLKLQNKNRDLTKKTIDFIKHQKQSSPQPQTTSTENQTKTLKKVQMLLEKANSFENKAIHHLDKSQYAEATKEEKHAIEKIEEALKELHKQNINSQNDPKSSPKEKNRKKDGQKQSQKEKKEEKETPKEKQRKLAKNKSHTKKQDQASPEHQPTNTDKKIAPKEALKRLSVLQKKANDEIKRREKKYGVPKIPSRAPIEKDW